MGKPERGEPRIRTLIVTLEHAIRALGADQTINTADRKISIYNTHTYI